MYSTYGKFLRDNDNNSKLKETFYGKDVNDAVVEQQREIGYIHRDPNTENIMVDPSTGAFNGLIDWDFAIKISEKERHSLPYHDFLHDFQDADVCKTYGYKYQRDNCF